MNVASPPGDFFCLGFEMAANATDDSKDAPPIQRAWWAQKLLSRWSSLPSEELSELEATAKAVACASRMERAGVGFVLGVLLMVGGLMGMWWGAAHLNRSAEQARPVSSASDPEPTPSPPARPALLVSLPPPAPPPPAASPRALPPSPAPRPLPPSPALPTLPSSLAPSRSDWWTRNEATNCFGNGNGAEDLRWPSQVAEMSATSLADCQVACIRLDGCEALVVSATQAPKVRCYARRSIDTRHCRSDVKWDLYRLPVTPRPPPEPPRTPPSPTPPGAPLPPMAPPNPPAHPPIPTILALNERFRLGHPSDRLSEAGVLLHVFDKNEDPYQKWLPCSHGWCMRYSDRLAASIVSVQQRGLFGGAPGLVYHPEHTNIRCSYSCDGGSMSGKAPGGCLGRPCTRSYPWKCSWPAGDLRAMLEQPTCGKGRGYNEVVVDTTPANYPLPEIIEAFFIRWDEDADPTRQIHRRFLSAYGVSAEQYPLVKLDLNSWDNPFSVIDG